MGWIKKIFSRKKEIQHTTYNVGNSSFKEQVKQDIIPRVWQLVEKQHWRIPQANGKIKKECCKCNEELQ